MPHRGLLCPLSRVDLPLTKSHSSVMPSLCTVRMPASADAHATLRLPSPYISLRCSILNMCPANTHSNCLQCAMYNQSKKCNALWALCIYANPHCTMHMHVYILWNAQSHVYNSTLYNALKTVHMPWLIKQGIAIPPSHSNAFSSWYVTTHDTTFVPWAKNLASGEILHALVGRRQWRNWRSLKNIFLLLRISSEILSWIGQNFTPFQEIIRKIQFNTILRLFVGMGKLFKEIM